ncbi:oxidoreductase [Deinococcus piscis]|uniref:Propionate 3-nitronate monooxygenase n=1 Tax=Deinococcus piscis TaxID=394230 RepID=A0ABQ3KBH8_9DEIO|nr:nitronate monooxygenase [Deinococcus piscis]GHG10329.1 oxidoreductase [Deinococcus piscis]
MPKSPFPARLPLVQAPMAGVTTPELVAAVSEAGALGSLGAGYLSAERLAADLKRIRQLTPQPFMVNLFVPDPEPQFSADELNAALTALQPMLNDLQLPRPTLAPPYAADFGDQLCVLLEEAPAAVSFTFGLPDTDIMRAFQAQGTQVWLTVTSLEEGEQAAALHPDALVAQGRAAGGHRGGWQADALAPTVELTQELLALGQPVVAAGGLMTPGDIRRALEAGAAAAQCGTAFLLAREAGTSAPYREALEGARRGGEAAMTMLTRGPSGRLARGLVNRLAAVDTVLPYPAQNALTQPLRAEATRQHRPEWLSLWAGEQVAELTGERSAAELVRWLTSEL